jgi:replicative DNA helicase
VQDYRKGCRVTKASYQTAADVFSDWRESVLTGEPPILYRVGDGELARIEIGPKLVTLVGGPPGAGKTALAMQFTVDGLRLNPDLRAVVCNIEMPAAVLLDRQLSRLSGIPAETIRYRRLDAAHADRLDRGMSTLETIAERLCFVRPPFDLANVASTADEFGGRLLVLDYIQLIPPPGEHGDRRGSVDATMNYLRQFADAGVAVLVVAAVARQKDSRGRSSYGGDALTLASFRESSELEFGADDAFILAPDDKAGDGVVVLRHLKARHTEPRDIRMLFDRRLQSFAVDTAKPHAKPDGKLQASLVALWNRTKPANDEPEGGDDD